jgi:hypothetical protein
VSNYGRRLRIKSSGGCLGGKQELTRVSDFTEKVIAPVELAFEIEQAVKNLLEVKTVKLLLYNTSDRERTRLVKDRLCNIGRALGFHVTASNCQSDDGEWLYDMAWFNKGPIFTRQAVVIECEWRNGVKVEYAADVDGDFHKLIQARADVRVWISTAHNNEIASQYIANCKDAAESFLGSAVDDLYLLFVLVWSDMTFRMERFQPKVLGQLAPRPS